MKKQKIIKNRDQWDASYGLFKHLSCVLSIQMSPDLKTISWIFIHQIWHLHIFPVTFHCHWIDQSKFFLYSSIAGLVVWVESMTFPQSWLFVSPQGWKDVILRIKYDDEPAPFDVITSKRSFSLVRSYILQAAIIFALCTLKALLCTCFNCIPSSTVCLLLGLLKGRFWMRESAHNKSFGRNRIIFCKMEIKVWRCQGSLWM